MRVTSLPIVTLSSFSQNLKAWLPIYVTPGKISTDVMS